MDRAEYEALLKAQDLFLERIGPETCFTVNLIREMHVEQIYSVIQTSSSEGMSTMNNSLKRLCDQGLIDVESAIRSSSRTRELMRLLEFQ